MFCINYVIKQGDTLYSISRHYNVSVDAIIAANPYINVYNLQVDEAICIPVSVPQGGFTNYTTYLVQDGDTLGSIMQENGANMGDLMQLNDANSVYLQPGSTIKIPIMGAGKSGITL